MNGIIHDPEGRNSSQFVFTGYNINATAGSRTIFASDLAQGMVLQLDPNVSQSTPSGLTPGLGERVGTPTAGQKLGFVVVRDKPATKLNEKPDSTAPTLRRGGQFTGTFKGMVQALVAQDSGGAMSPGQYLAPTTSATLGKTASTSVAESLVRIGATAEAWAMLMETVAQGSGTVLAWVEIK